MLFSSCIFTFSEGDNILAAAEKDIADEILECKLCEVTSTYIQKIICFPNDMQDKYAYLCMFFSPFVSSRW